MAHIDDVLDQSERILYTTRRHLLLVISLIVAKTVLIGVVIAAGFISFEAFRNTSEKFLGIFTANELILVGGGLISLILLISIGGDYIRWQAEQYLITDHRLIQVQGILNKTIVGDVSLDHIKQVTLHSNLFGRLVGYGTLVLETTGENDLNTLLTIVRPRECKQALLEARHNYENGYGYLDTDDSAYPPEKTLSNGQATAHRTLEELAALRDRGILSIAEFEAKKREILSRL